MAFELLSNNNEYVSRNIYNEYTNKATFWVPTRNDLEDITSFIFDVDNNIFEDIGQKLFNADPQKAIISCRLFPIEFGYITGAVGTKSFKLMNTDIPSNQSPYLVNYIKPEYIANYIDFGYIDIPLVEDMNSFLSYEPHTRLFLYLPFAPLVPLDTRRVSGNRIRVKGVLDLYEGAMNYFVEYSEDNTNWTFLYTTTAAIAIDIPMYKSNDYDVRRDLVKNLLSGLTSMAVSGAVRGVAGIGKAGVKTLSNTLDILNFETSVLQQGNFNSLAGFFQPLKVNLIRYKSRIKYHLDDTDYNHLYGVPCKKIDKLNTFGGFTKVGGIHIKEIPNATTEEIKEIESLLLEGVILDNTSAIFDVYYDYNNTQVSLTNTQDKVIFGGTYTTVANALSGYQIDSISVTMGGIDITSTAVSGNTITIPSISGNIRIRIVSSTIPVYFTISYSGLVGATLSNTSVSILQGTSYYTNITPDYANNYIMSDYVPTVTMAGQPVSIGVTSERIDIANVQGNIIISGTYPQVSTMINYWERRDTIMTLPEEPIVLTNLNVTFEDGVTQYTGDDIVIDNQTDVAGYFISFTTYNNDSIGIGQTGAIYVNDVYTSQLTAIEFNESQEYYSSYSGLLEWLDKNFTL